MWLIVGGVREGNEARPLTVELPGRGRALAVFSFEEETQMYLQAEAPEGVWRVEEVGVEELTSMLLWGGCSWVKRLALDPIPPQLAIPEANVLTCTSREAFLDLLLRRDSEGDSEDAAMVGSRGKAQS